MEAKRKIQYETPALQVVEISSENALCTGSGPDQVMIWSLSGDNFISPSTDWGRSGYGNATEF